MGLLDEAIRDHLELKRQRGADPSEIARAEREALEPVFPPEGTSPEPGVEPPHDDPGAAALDAAVPPDEEQRFAEQAGYGGQATTPSEQISTLGQETAELDMEAVLEQDARLAAGVEPIESAPQAADGDEELLEWEMPDRATAEPPPEPIPGQERLSFE
jgi:hypothetical protein